MIKIEEKELLRIKGISLSARLPNDDDETGKVDRFITYVSEKIYNFIGSNSSRNIGEDSILTEYKKEQLLRAMYEQAIYMIVNGDVSLMSGFDSSSNSLADIKELRKRNISPEAESILVSSGFMFRGI